MNPYVVRLLPVGHSSCCAIVSCGRAYLHPHHLAQSRRALISMATQATRERRPIVISGPSGTGKSTILKRLFDKYPDKFGFSISHTTRQPRGQEKNGVEYHFVAVPEFEKMIGDGGFIEHARFGGNYYGTSFQAVQDVADKGRTCILDIEMEGVKQIHKDPALSRVARFLFLSPPSFEVLERRLRGRGTDSEDAIAKRLAQARAEMDYSRTEGAHDRIVVNDDLDRAWAEVEAWVFEDAEAEKQ